MKKLLMMIGAAAVAVGAYAVEYTYTGGTVSPADGNVTILCNDGGAITNLTMAATNAETMALGGDNLAFAAGANVKVIGNALVSNTFTTAGALVFSGVTNATWRGDYLTSDSTTLFTGVNLDHIVPLSGYGKRGTAEAEETDAFLYRAFYVVRDGNTMRFELQQIHGKYAKGIFIELTQSGDNIIGRRLLGGNRNSDKYGQQMFKYENGTASMVSGNTNPDYTPMTLEIGPRSGTPSALTLAVSGTVALPAVSGGGITVKFDSNAGGEPTEVFTSETLCCGKDSWVTLCASTNLADITLRTGRIGGSWSGGAEGKAATVYDWQNDGSEASGKLWSGTPQASGSKGIEFSLRQNGANVEICVVHTMSDTRTDYAPVATTPNGGGYALLWVSTKPTEPSATINANGANTMTDSAYVVSGDAMHPIIFNVGNVRALPAKTTDCYGDAELHLTVGNWSSGGQSAITMHQGSRLYHEKAHAFMRTKQTVVLDGAELHMDGSGEVSYLNWLTFANGAAAFCSETANAINAGYDVDNAKWQVTGAGCCTNDVSISLRSSSSSKTSGYRELEIAVEDVVAGDGFDFVMNGTLTVHTSYPNAAFVKTGAGTMTANGTLACPNAPARIVEGTLLLGASGVTAAEHKFALEGGTLALAAGTTNTAASVAVSESSSLSFGSDAALTLSNLTIDDGTMLTLSGDVPKKGLKVETALDAATLGRIQFADGRTGKVGQTSDGYVRANREGLTITFY